MKKRMSPLRITISPKKEKEKASLKCVPVHNSDVPDSSSLQRSLDLGGSNQLHVNSPCPL